MCTKCFKTLIDRRNAIALAAAGVTALGIGTRMGAARAAEGDPTTLTSDQALAALKDGNAKFVADPQVCTMNLTARRAQVARHQAPWASIVSCADSRVPPELIFGGLGLGELFVARNAGNLVDTATLGTLEYGAAVLGSPLIVVLAHTSCGAVAAACGVVTKNANYPGSIGPMIDPIIPAALSVRDAKGDFVNNAAAESAKRTAARIGSASSLITGLVAEGKLDIVSAMYDLSKGTVAFLD